MQSPEWFRAPSQILADLGIEDPADIDVEAIAEDCGATIVFRELTGCAARIMGHNDRAIITIDSSSRRPRQRFSAGHELGHWMRDRGQASFQCDSKTFVKEWSADNPETRANRFASDLLLPSKMFRPRIQGRPVTFDTVKDLGNEFSTSITATAIRLVEYGELPAVIVCNSLHQRHWFAASSEVRNKIWLEPSAQPGSLAHDLLHNRGASISAREVGADVWFNHPGSKKYWIHEDSISISDQFVLTLLWWKNESQLVDIDNEIEQHDARRSDFRRDD